MEDVRFSSSGENAAIISYKQTWTGSDHGKRFEIVIYTHGHWEKRGGQWMVTLWQDTPAEKSSTPAAETKPTLILPPSPDRPNVQTEVISHERAFLEALKRNECATASGFMSDGLTAIGGNGMKGKAEYMKLCETRQKQWTEYELEQVQVYPTRADSAVLVKKVIFSGTDQGKQFKSIEYGHEDWERHNEGWQITALQDTPQAATSKAEAETTVVNLDVHTKFTPFHEMIIGKEKEVPDLTARGDYATGTNLLSDDAVAVYGTGYASESEVLKALKGMSDIYCAMDKVRLCPSAKPVL